MSNGTRRECELFGSRGGRINEKRMLTEKMREFQRLFFAIDGKKDNVVRAVRYRRSCVRTEKVKELELNQKAQTIWVKHVPTGGEHDAALIFEHSD